MDKLIADIMLPNYPIIWDRSRKDFRDNNKKENAFKALAQEVNAPTETVVARYKALREKYRKEKQKMDMSTKSGAGTTDTDVWELFESLSFLDGVMLSRKRVSNIVPVANETSTPVLHSQNTESHSSDVGIDSEDPDVEWVTSPQSSVTLELQNNSAFDSTITDERPVRGTKRKQIGDSNTGLQKMIQALQDTAASLNNNTHVQEASKSKYDWLAKYIAACLNDMNSNVANEKSRQLLNVLNDS